MTGHLAGEIGIACVQLGWILTEYAGSALQRVFKHYTQWKVNLDCKFSLI